MCLTEFCSSLTIQVDLHLGVLTTALIRLSQIRLSRPNELNGSLFAPYNCNTFLKCARFCRFLNLDLSWKKTGTGSFFEYFLPRKIRLRKVSSILTLLVAVHCLIRHCRSSSLNSSLSQLLFQKLHLPRKAIESCALFIPHETGGFVCIINRK